MSAAAPGLGVILPAAGRSTRFGAGRNKLFEMLQGRPVILHALQAFLQRADVLAVALPTSDAPALARLIDRFLGPIDPRIILCTGGQTRAHSVRQGLLALPPGVEWVAVHDAARPLVSQELIDRTLAAAQSHGAAVPALPVALTIKEAAGPLPAPAIRTIPRQSLFAMQTPQIMRCADLLSAFDRCTLPFEQITDDAQVLELAGLPVWLVPGEERNLKITTAQDMTTAHLLLSQARDNP